MPKGLVQLPGGAWVVPWDPPVDETSAAEEEAWVRLAAGEILEPFDGYEHPASGW